MSKRSATSSNEATANLRDTIQSVAPLIPHLKAAGVRAFCEPSAGNDDLVRHLVRPALRLQRRHCARSGRAPGRANRCAGHYEPAIHQERPTAAAEHFIATAPLTWLLLPADFAHVAYARPYLSRCTAIVSAGRARWLGGSGTEDVSWFRFTRDQSAGPVFYNGDPIASRSTVCEECGIAFQSSRADAKTCSDRCRKRLQRRRSANRDASVTDTTCEVSGHEMQGKAARPTMTTNRAAWTVRTKPFRRPSGRRSANSAMPTALIAGTNSSSTAATSGSASGTRACRRQDQSRKGARPSATPPRVSSHPSS